MTFACSQKIEESSREAVTSIHANSAWTHDSSVNSFEGYYETNRMLTIDRIFDNTLA